MKTLLSIFTLLIFSSALLADTTGAISANTTRQLNENGGGGSSGSLAGQVDNDEHHFLAKWDNPASVPTFAKVNSVKFSASFNTSPALTISLCGQSWGSGSTWNSLTNGMTLGSWLATKPANVTGWNKTTADHNNTIQKWVDGQCSFNGICFTSAFNGPSYSSVSSVTIEIDYTTRLGGDVDLDGDVDFQDFLELARNYGESGKDWEHGDFDNDDTVGFSDYLTLAQNFGGTEDIELP